MCSLLAGCPPSQGWPRSSQTVVFRTTTLASSPLWSPGLAQVLISQRKCSLASNPGHHIAPSPGSQLFGMWAAEALWAVHLVQPWHCCHVGQSGLGGVPGSAEHWQLGTCCRLSSPGTYWVATSIWSPSGLHTVPQTEDKKAGEGRGRMLRGRAGAEEQQALPGLREAHSVPSSCSVPSFLNWALLQGAASGFSVLPSVTTLGSHSCSSTSILGAPVVGFFWFVCGHSGC